MSEHAKTNKILKKWRNCPSSLKLNLVFALWLTMVFAIWADFNPTKLEQFCGSKTLFPVISLVLTVEGIIFGIFALSDSQKQEEVLESQRKKLEKVTGHLEDISNSLPTRYIGAFPHHLKDIFELVEKSQEKFYIMTDGVDYGSFSEPDLHGQLIQKIADVISQKKIKVQMVVDGKPAPISRSSPFFGIDFNVLCKDAKFLDCLENYLQHHPEFVRPKDDDAFKEMLMRHHKQVDDFLQKAGAKIVFDQNFGNSPGVFFWISDDVEAVFLLSHTGIGTQGLAFRTRDTKLLKIFESTFEKRCPPTLPHHLPKKSNTPRPAP